MIKSHRKSKCLDLLLTLILLQSALTHVSWAGENHTSFDQFAAEVNRLLPATSKQATKLAAPPPPPLQNSVLGSWTPAIAWSPHIPTTAAVLPDGRLLTFSSNQPTTFPDGPQFTYAAVWDPVTGLFTEINNQSHDMFCGGVSMLQDGRLLVNGGNGIEGTTALASLFDWRTNQWTQVQTMADGRWYNTSVALPNGEVFTASGNAGETGAGSIEQWNSSTGWRSMSGIAWAAVANPGTLNAIEPNWHPFLLVAPDGKLAHFGPHDALHSITTIGTGVMTTPGATIPGTHYPKQGSWAMYEKGKIVVMGGLSAIDNGTVVSSAYKVDLNGSTPVVTSIAPMANARSFANSVMLPNGEVMVVGGTSVGTFFSDAGTIYTPEIWNPTSETWRPTADISIPRNYHSLALLLTDGRVWSGGGGLSGDPVTDHRDAQVFTPPQLFNADGTLAVRPEITAAPLRIGPGVTFSVSASPNVNYFSFIKLASQTHSVGTDMRHLRLTHSSPSSGTYSVIAPASINVLTPGYWMLYAVNASGVWSVSRIIQVTNETLPVVTNPSLQSVIQGVAVTLPISASTGVGTLSYSASGLPLGLSISGTTGVISGIVTAQPGTYQCSVFAAANSQVTSVHFKWVVVLPNLGSGQIMREWWTGITGGTVASLTSHATYPANPKGRDLLSSFEAPINWEDNMGQRVRGFLHVPVTGQYQFYIASDDQSSLRLSTSTNPVAAIEIASVPAWTEPRAYGWYSQQTSALISLAAGTKYYVEALMKEGTSGDHLSVAWKKPGDATPTEIAGTYLSPYNVIENAAITWSFDESSWNGTANEVKATFRSLYGLHGSAAGGVTTTTVNAALTGNPGTFRSAVFNGATQSVTIPYNAALNANDFTIAAWVRMDSAVGTARCLLSSRDDAGTVKTGYSLWITATGNWQFRTGADTTALNGPLAVQGQWTHIAASFRTTSLAAGLRTGLRRLFINGVQVAEGSGTYTVNTTRPLVIAAADSPGVSFFQGGVDEATFYHQPLSLEDIISVRDLRHNFTGNQSPIVTTPGPQSSLRSSNVSLSIIANDPEGAALSYSAAGLPTGLNLTAGVISGSPTVAAVFNPVITVTDGASTPTSISFSWAVTDGLTVAALSGSPKLVNTNLSFAAVASNGLNPLFKWNFGDGSPETAFSSSPNATRTYTASGRYLVTLTATDSSGVVVTRSYRQAIYAALTSQKPKVSSSIAFEDLATGNDRIWCVNPDNNSVSAFDAVTLNKLAEITVGTGPRCIAFAPDGRAWVSNTESGTISIINTTTFTVASTVTLARGARPFGLVFNTVGTSRAWVALEGTSKILRLSVSTGGTNATIDLTAPVRHLSLSADGTRLYASRFITPAVPGENTATPNLNGTGGQVVVIGTAALVVQSTILLQPSTAPDTQTSSRGLPNYLGPAVISPDGLSAWVPSKLDNIQRGIFRDNQALNHENSVRAIVSRLDLVTQTAHLPSRIDIDNAGMPSAGAYDPWGIYVFTALEASREIAVIDSWSRQEVLRFPAGRAPQGVTLSPNGLTLYVHNFMDRSITIHNISNLIQGGNTAPVINSTLNAVATESLSAEVLQGKKLFYDAKDPRLALQEYMSCATCHNDGSHDGRTWDLTGFGEGLRNTITLKGHGNQGTLHWTGNFDEVQDFEGQIRGLAGGTGLINSGTPHPPMGTANAGRSADLDALAAYVKSLTTDANSPVRTSAGGLSTAAIAGQQVFRVQNCAACHGGTNFSNSALNVFANIGTQLPSSGQRLGAALTGFDVPTLRGAFATGPYLHDGRAATLAASISAHQGVTLSTTDLNNLVAFVQSIDSQPSTAPLPFTVALTTPLTTVGGPFTVTATFNASTTNFILSDVTVTNAAVSAMSGSGATYTFTVTPLAVGAVTVRVLANAATDSTALGNLVSNTLSLSLVNSDTTPPSVSLTTTATAVTAPFTVNATFSETVTGLLANEFTVTNGSVTALSSAGTLWIATVTPTVAGTVTVNLPANRAQDAAGNGNTLSNTLTVTYTPPPAVTGITGTYYEGKNFETLRFNRIDNNIDFTWAGAPDPQLPPDGFSVRWQGCIVAPTTGSYDITTRSDDGVRLWLNGAPVITNWTNHGETWDSTTITLQANVPVTLTMEFYEDESSAVARLWWSGPGIAFSAIPNSALRINENGMIAAPYPATYAAWLGSARAPSSPNADGDDIPDLMEYALGSSATTGVQPLASGLQLNVRPGNAVDATLVKPAAVTDLSYELEVSTDLVSWSPLKLIPTLVDDSPGLQRLTWSNIHLYGSIARLRVRQTGGVVAVSSPVGLQQLSLYAGTQSYGYNLIPNDIFSGFIASNTSSRVVLKDKSSLTSMVDPTLRYYAEIKSGTQVGHRFDIQFFSDDAFTIAPSSVNHTLDAIPVGLAGSQVAIRPHATLGSIFDKTKFTASTRQGNADQVLFYSPSGYLTYWLRQSGSVSQWTLASDANLANADATALSPGTGVLLSLIATPTQPFVKVGKVRVTPFVRPLSLGYQLFANPWPITLTPQSAGLTSSAFLGSTNPSTADALQIWAGDQTPSLDSYIGYWLLQSSTQSAAWIANGSAQMQSQNNQPILSSGRATFIQIRETVAPRPLWILSPP